MNDNRLAQARNFLDINGLNSIRHEAKTGDDASKKEALAEAAKQFEAIFMQMLLKSMRKAEDVLASDSPFNSESTKFYRDMHDQQMAVDLSSNGTLGLSALIVRQLGGDDDDFTPSSVLRNDGQLNGQRNDTNVSQIVTNSEVKSTVNPVPNLIDIPLVSLSKNSQPEVQSVTNTSNFQQFISPTSSTSPTFKQPQDFVTALVKPAQAVEDQLGIPFEVVIAQAALETGWGQKIIQKDQSNSSHNLFNIKADTRWEGDKVTKDTLEFEQGALVKKSAPFRVYSSIDDSINDYIHFLSSNERYQPALEQASNVEHFLHGIQKAGYATDPNYADKIMATLRTVSSLLNR